ncbi:uncharacterized protein KLLA0_D19945g [Kluyveromyces lactis]|uniref:KLLA0D19945p n=1 Tax=Kluyveromyces lactis (strain ATCC 8585 / CBS 2359 / DSM 70799 / NBRC 1267 / NRRL Y-1140 / WM37) TaxID=284590 RepID=B5FV84_KLULA|nr:uncharacterized protein KLLA0_D19945g [Kluyveromyces lactis]CAR64385.1 KLLA0D19945p [Kluyveromyces lactis]|eukprot:XP_002999381.1 uncharacterized protein KLLA0_D19945g [Kluyveromyces lactis]
MNQPAVSPEWEQCEYDKDSETDKRSCKKEQGIIHDIEKMTVVEETQPVGPNLEITARFSTKRKMKELEIVSSFCKEWHFQSILLVTAIVCGFSYNLDAVLRSTYTGYATNSFSQHSLLATINVINSVVSIASQLFFARLSDHFGRLQLFGFCTLMYIVGTILQSQSKNVSIYAGGAVFYNAGYTGVRLLMTIMMSDFSTLGWRYFMIASPDWCYIIITWVSGNIIEISNPLENWSWDIAMWAFIFPLTTIPLVGFLVYMFYKASRTDEWKELRSVTKKMPTPVYIKEVFWNLDIPGVLLIAISLGCILIPLTVSGGETEEWKDSRNIGVLCLGSVLFPIFLLWEGKIAKRPVLALTYLKDRGVWAPLAASFFMSNAYLIATDYLYAVLLVGFNQSESASQRITWLPSFAGVVITPFTGLLITRWKHLKVLTITGCIFYYIAFGLFYRYRGGSTNVAGIIVGTIFMGFGSGISTYPLMVSLQAVSSHTKIAIVTALFYTFEQVGRAVGSSISGAIWTQVMFKEISKRLPEEPEVALAAYASPYTFVTKYGWETSQRMAVVGAYMHVQKILLLVALLMLCPLFLMAIMMRDAELSTSDVALSSSDDSHVIISKHEDKIYEAFCKFFSFSTKKEGSRERSWIWKSKS